jgi:hypothetical protein
LKIQIEKKSRYSDGLGSEKLSDQHMQFLPSVSNIKVPRIFCVYNNIDLFACRRPDDIAAVGVCQERAKHWIPTVPIFKRKYK